MALELLAGPFPVTDIDAAAPVPVNAGRILWVDPRGLLIVGTVNTYLVQMDGSAYAIGIPMPIPGLSLLGSSEDPYGGDPWYSSHHHGVGVDGRDERILDRVFLNSGALIRSDHPDTTLQMPVTLHDRWLVLQGASVYSSSGVGVAYAIEHTFSGLANANAFSWARERGHLWIGGDQGHVVLYDYINQVAASPLYQIGNTSVIGVFYSKKHDVFVSLHSDGSQYLITVWARTPVPASIAAPTFNVTPAPGLVVTATTRVLGSNGEVCVNEAVAWSVTGEGTLVADTSLTDASGYATAQIEIPVDAAGPDMTVTVEVVVP